MTQEEIQRSGMVTVGDIINSMTVAGTPDFSKGSALTSNREQGGQYINMRGLGSQRLLVLVDGKRWTTSVAGYTDLSTVPTALIERIEVLKDGASAVYGSDAIAGVVNIILKKNMKGGSISVYGGKNRNGDGSTGDYSFSMGANNDAGSIVFGATKTTQGAVWAKDRQVTAYSYGPEYPDANYGTGPWGRIRQVSATGAATGFNKVLNNTSDNLALGTGTGADARNPLNYHTYAGANADKFNSTNQMMFQMPTELTSFFTKATAEITPDMRAYATAMYGDRNSNRQIAGYPLNSLTQTNYPVYIDKNSYYNPYGNAVAGAGLGQDLFFYRRTIEVPRVTINDSKSTHLDGGLQGEFNMFGNTWNWNTGYNYNNVSGNVTSTGNLNLINLKSALGPSFMNASGVVQCGTPSAPVSLATCVPFNILGGPSASTQNALNYVMSTGQATYGSTVTSFMADVAGDVFTLPAGKVGVAAGVEKRSVKGYDRPGTFEQSGFSTDLAGNATVGSYNVTEGYLETNIPLLKDKPLIDKLSLNLASRSSKYSNFGSTTNSKASFLWKTNSELLIRGTYSQGFRAPTVGDTFGGGSQSFDSYLDPCDSVNGAAKNNAAVAARCLAAGVPSNYRQLNQSGSPVSAGGGQSTVPFLAGAGNADIQPETALTKTFGFVVNPSVLPNLTASVDYYKIDVDNRITAVSAGYILGQCYVQGVSSFCNKFRRDATGMVSYLERGNANLGNLSTEGIDLGVNYAFPANEYGKFGVRSQSSYVKSYKIKSSADANWFDYAGEYDTFHFKSNIFLDWSKDSWTATFATRYYGSVKTQCWSGTEAACNNPNGTASWGTGYIQQKPMIFNDISVGYKTASKGQLVFGVNNVFGGTPRVIYNASYTLGGSSSSSAVDPNMPIDKFFFARFTQPF
jgi:iron complex outermembrane receptor protein